MLNKFKNALYGTSTANDADTISARLDYDSRKAVIGKRIRSALTRSSSFSEDLLREVRIRNDDDDETNNNNNNIGNPKCRSLGQNNNSDNFSSSNASDHSHQQLLTARDAYIRDKHNNNNKAIRLPKFRYSRPEFLQLKTDDEILVSADHQIRPIILPRDVSRLPWKSGYAECINAGKSLRNEDQAACYQDVVVRKSATLQLERNNSDSVGPENSLPWVYFGIFDGHAGTAVAVAAASQLHHIIGEKLHQVADLLIALEFDVENDVKTENGKSSSSDEYLDCSQTVQAATEKETRKLEANEVKEETKNDKDDAGETGDRRQEISNNNTATSTHPSETTTTTDAVNILSSDPHTTPEKSHDQQLAAVPEDDKTTPTTQEDTVEPEQQQQQQQDDSSNRKQQHRQQSTAKEHLSTPERRLPSMVDICRNNVSVDSLIVGALESSFWEMDSMIAQDKYDFTMAGGCTAIVSVFVLGKLYVCNAGDSRAIVYKNDQVIPMSFDFTPTSERERILRLGLQRPEFLGSDFTHLEFLKRPTRRDLGKQMLYKDAYMTGWSMKTITFDDLKFPLVWGEGKRSRVLATIGVTRGFGDHELRAQYGSVLIKPFLTPEPEVKILPLEGDESLAPEDVLIMGSDGLWDVTTNQEAANIVKNSFDLFPDSEETRSKYRYITAAQDLVIHSRGHTTNQQSNIWRTHDDRLASLDDIAVFVIPLKQYKDEYVEWKRLRSQAKSRASAKETKVTITTDSQ